MRKSSIYKIIEENKFPNKIKLVDRAVTSLKRGVDKLIERLVDLMRGE